jgi:hypothetical protein
MCKWRVLELTHLEIEQGIFLASVSKNSAYCFIPNIVGLSYDDRARKYMEVDENQNPNSEVGTALSHLPPGFPVFVLYYNTM